MRPTRIALALIAALVVVLGAAAPAPAAVVLDSVGSNNFGLIADGTSNTILFAEETRATLCFDDVTVAPGIADGTSNTLILSETIGFRTVPTRVLPRVSITDATSNTIFFGEIQPDEVCFRGTRLLDPVTVTDGLSNTIVLDETSRFDVCFDDVRVGLRDGTSNTILFGENRDGVCFEQVGVDGGLRLALAGPGTLAGFGAGLLALWLLRGRVAEASIWRRVPAHAVDSGRPRMHRRS